MACEHGMPLRLLASKLNLGLTALQQLVGFPAFDLACD